MTEAKAHILVTDDERAIRNTLKEILEYEGYEVSLAESGNQAIKMLSKKKVHLVFLDIKMKGMDGLETLIKIRESGNEVPVVMISGHGNIDIAVQATRQGAYDFLEKPPDLNRLLLSARNALSQHSLAKEIHQIRKRIPKVPEIIGKSPAIQEVKNLIEKVALSKSRVLISGENGTGKELVARWIHEKSARRNAPFVEVNCAAIPSELIESELFGHEKGAFTGAVETRKGKFEQAEGGTIFLDEIGDMPLDAQAKVLRVLQQNTVTKVGGSTSIPVDVRVLAATNKNLEQEIEAGSFREDLFHRLNVIPVYVPALRDRRTDIPLIAESCLARLKNEDISFINVQFTQDGLAELETLPWGGNVRELQNAVERLGILSMDGSITRDLIQRVMKSRKNAAQDLESLADSENDFQLFKEAAERVFLVKQLSRHDWNISRTAEAVGLQRSHIYNKMKKYNIER